MGYGTADGGNTDPVNPQQSAEIADDYGSCFRGGIPVGEVFDFANPTVGRMFVYGGTAEGASGEGPLGETYDGLPRPNPTPCPP